jgi:hypothetical protein
MLPVSAAARRAQPFIAMAASVRSPNPSRRSVAGLAGTPRPRLTTARYRAGSAGNRGSRKETVRRPSRSSLTSAGIGA